jgi:GT2 family glycosyltransferase
LLYEPGKRSGARSTQLRSPADALRRNTSGQRRKGSHTMHEAYFRIIAGGLHGELAVLSVDEVLRHLANYRANFHLDRDLAVCYMNRLLKELSTPEAPRVLNAVGELLGKSLQLSPFEIVNTRTKPLLDNPDTRLKIEILDSTNAEPETFGMIDGLDLAANASDVAEFCRKLLAAYPNYALAAGKLLAAQAVLGQSPDDWLPAFRCPRRLADDFNAMLLLHRVALGQAEEAERLFLALPNHARGEVVLNAAAEAARMLGDTQAAIARYSGSLRLDPAQGAVRFRLAELMNPSRKRPELVERRKVGICLYTYNKAALLKSTLESLAASNIGGAGVTVLVNGCTDESLAVAEAARPLFPGGYTVIPLHVNIGAPAARNWLIHLPGMLDNDYVAFLDDDVDVPADWLEWYLTLAEADPKVGAVGGKIVYPGAPAMLQYLFRYVSVANGQLLKLNLGAPKNQYDFGFYDFIRETRSVMGCLHLLRSEALRRVPSFDIRFSPSQVDDIDHDLCLCLAGYKVMYCGHVACVHHQSSGLGDKTDWSDAPRIGNGIGNDVKLFYKHYGNMEALQRLDNLSLLPPEWRPAGAAG